MSLPYPFFSGRVPQQSFALKVDNVTDTTTATVTVDFSGGSYFYLVRGLDTFYAASSLDATYSIWRVLLDALNSGAAFGGTWSVKWTATKAKGLAATLVHSGKQFELDGLDAATTLPLELFGWTDDVHQSDGVTFSLVSEQHPRYCWFPWSPLNERRPVPFEQQVYSSGPTADGSTYTVRHDDGAIRRWYRFQVDGSSNAGVAGGRVSHVRHFDPWRDEWRDQTGADRADPYVALDATDGWWHRTVDGTPWFITRSLYEPFDSRLGPFRFVYPGPNDLAAPVDMESWRSLREPSVVETLAGRSVISIACIEA